MLRLVSAGEVDDDFLLRCLVVAVEVIGAAEDSVDVVVLLVTGVVVDSVDEEICIVLLAVEL